MFFGLADWRGPHASGILVGDVPLPDAMPPPPPPSAAAARVVMLVEDEEPIRELIGMALSGRGYTVHICGESRDALTMARSLPAPPDLLITDIHMAGLSGPDLARHMTAEFPALRILFISGYANTSEPVRAALAFENGTFLRKPFSLAAFREQVDGVLGGLQASAPPA